MFFSNFTLTQNFSRPQDLKYVEYLVFELSAVDSDISVKASFKRWVKVPFALLSEGGIVVFSWVSGGFDPSTGSISRGAGINNLSGFQFKTLLSKLVFKLREAIVIKVHGFEIRAKARTGDRIYGRQSEEAAVEEVAFEHKFHFRVGMAI